MCKVGENDHVYISTHQYSMPYEYVNQKVSIVYSQEAVEVYDSDYTRIVLHKRLFRRYGYTAIKDHMPSNHIVYEYHKNQKNAVCDGMRMICENRIEFTNLLFLQNDNWKYCMWNNQKLKLNLQTVF